MPDTLWQLLAGLLVLWLLMKWDDRRMRREVWNRTGAVTFARFDALNAEFKRRQAEAEARRTRWSWRDSGYVFVRAPHGTERPSARATRLANGPDAFVPQWQGILHSSGRPEMERWNAERQRRLDQLRADMSGRGPLRKTTASEPARLARGETT